MIAVTILHETIRRSINDVNSDWLQAINTVDLDAYINKAKDYILHNYTRLAESSKEFENHLRELEVPYIDLAIQQSSTKPYIVAKLPSNYYEYLKLNIIGSKQCGDSLCKDDIWNIRYYQNDDISLNDPNYEPSWEWRSALFNINKNGIFVYHNNKYNIDKVSLTYIRDIPDVAAPSLVIGGVYSKADGSIMSRDIDLDISSTMLWRKICELAEFYIKKDKHVGYSATIDSIMFNEKTATP